MRELSLALVLWAAALPAGPPSPYVTVERIGASSPLLTVTDPARPAIDKRVVWVMDAQRSAPAEGAVRFLQKDDPVAARLRGRFIFKFLSAAGPDGAQALRKAVLEWVDGGRPVDLFLSLRDSESDYLEGPLSAAGPAYRDMVKCLAAALGAGPPRDWPPGEPGGDDLTAALFRERGIPVLVLARKDHRKFADRLAPALAEAVDGRTRSANLIVNPGFTDDTGGMPAGWKLWASRNGPQPKARVIPDPDGNLLQLETTAAAAFGKATTEVKSIRIGASYRFEVWYRPSAIDAESVSLPIVLTWVSPTAERGSVQRDYIDTVARYGAWRKAERTLEAPAGTQFLRVELGLRWAGSHSVLWKAPRIEEVEPLPRRKVRVVTTHVVPPFNATQEGNRALMERAMDAAGFYKPDLVVFSENLADRYVRGGLADTAETIPGPTSETLGRKARQYSTYVVTSVHERDGGLFHNTAMLIDRMGRVAGKFRKVHLTLGESEGGLTPGDRFRVFPTDFGRIGMLVCWDYWFPESVRSLRLLGAELIALPIAGDREPHHWDVISRARAIDNGVFLVSSNTMDRSASRIINPQGHVLAETVERFGVAVAEIDLDQEWRLMYLSVGSMGEGRSLYVHERRPDTYAPLVDRGPR
jgi:predicted amidohydrolase